MSADHRLGTSRADDLTPFDRSVAEEPYPYYRRLRDLDGLQYSRNLEAWLLARYEDVANGFEDTGTYSSAPPGGSGPVRFLLTSDPPDHTALRKVVNRFFSTDVAADLESVTRRLTRKLLKDMDTRAATDGADLVRDLTAPLPVMVIATLMGMPVERHEEFRRWSDSTVGGVNMPTRQVARATIEMGRYFRDLLEARRREPGEDLISRLLLADEDMSLDEMQMFCGMLLIAGNETSTNLLSNAWLAMLEHPDQLAQLRAEPSLTRALLEETLRYDAPVQAVWRVAQREVDVRGSVISAGDRVLLLQASAGRDERQTERPDAFDLTRESIDHLGFGAGPHVCMGMNLARMEARVVAEEMLERYPRLRLAGRPERRLPPKDVGITSITGRPRVRRNPVVRGLDALPVAMSG